MEVGCLVSVQCHKSWFEQMSFNQTLELMWYYWCIKISRKVEISTANQTQLHFINMPQKFCV